MILKKNVCACFTKATRFINTDTNSAHTEQMFFTHTYSQILAIYQSFGALSFEHKLCSWAHLGAKQLVPDPFLE